MKIKFETTVDIDRAAWIEEFNLDPDANVEGDVEIYLRTIVHSQLSSVGVLVS
jgi:hypothetical protein